MSPTLTCQMSNSRELSGKSNDNIVNKGKNIMLNEISLVKMSEININDLPLEGFVEILSRIDGKTLGTCRRVCKKWQECIDGIDHLWHKFCEKDFKYSSRIAKSKSGNDCKWYHIYKNLKTWETVSSYAINIREFYKFSLHDKSHALSIDYSVLPLKDTRGIVLYDTNTLKYIPVVVPEKNCIKIRNNDHSTVILLKSGLYLQRTVNSNTYMAEAFFKADDFALSTNILYFYNNREVFKVDLTTENLMAQLIMKCEYDIKEILCSDGNLHIFTDCGKIVSLDKTKHVSEKSINCPAEWVRQIKHVCAIDDRNFVCYSRNLFKIQTDKYEHLYLDFPPITALFFYADIVLIGTRAGEVLLYRLSSQKRATKPIFEKLAVLPDGKFPVQLDVCERKWGPMIVAATFFEIYILEIDFFPHEQPDKLKCTFPTDKLCMYKRLLKVKNRLQCYLTFTQ